MKSGDIVIYRDDVGTVVTDFENRKILRFNYKDTNTSYYSLDSALVGCIGRKYEGGNGKAAMYFCKMIGIG